MYGEWDDGKFVVTMTPQETLELESELAASPSGSWARKLYYELPSDVPCCRCNNWGDPGQDDGEFDENGDYVCASCVASQEAEEAEADEAAEEGLGLCC